MEEKKGFLKSVSAVFSKTVAKSSKTQDKFQTQKMPAVESPKKDYLAVFREECHPNNYFFVHDGTIIKSIFGFRTALINMSDEAFNFHVTAEKNDFMSWIKYIFNNEDVADYIKNIKTKQNMVNALDTFFKSYIKEKSFLNKVDEAGKIVEQRELEEGRIEEDFAQKKHYHTINEVNYDEVRDYLIARHREIKSKLSEIRKKGGYTKLVEVILLNFKPKLHMFEATRAVEDKDKVEQLLEDAKNELLEGIDDVAV